MNLSSFGKWSASRQTQVYWEQKDFTAERWWFAYDVIRNMTMQIMTNLPQILLWPVRPYSASLYQFWTYWDQWKPSYGPKKLENFLLCYMAKWAGRCSFAYQHGCCNINVWKFSVLWTAVSLAFSVYRPDTCRGLSKPGYLHCIKILSKNIVNLNFWWRHCKPRIDFSMNFWYFVYLKLTNVGMIGFVNVTLKVRFPRGLRFIQCLQELTS